MAALARRLEARPLAPRSRVTCVVPARFARYLLVPWNELMQSAAARQLFAEHCFRETFGGLASGWQVRIDAPAYARASLACAIDAALPQALERMLAERGARVVSIQPALMHAVNAAGALGLSGRHWIVVPDAGVLTLLLLEDGVPLRVTQCAGTLAGLDAILAREAFFMPAGDVPAQARVHVCDAMPAPGAVLAQAA